MTVMITLITVIHTMATHIMNKSTKCILAAVLALSAISCTKDYKEGSPFILFEVHGTVMDVDGNPIEGIQVSSGTAEVKTTNVNGNFSFFGRSVPVSTASLKFEDKDKEENGGHFLTTTKSIPLVLKTPGTSSGSYKGTYFAQEVEVVMILKQQGLDTLHVDLPNLPD